MALWLAILLLLSLGSLAAARYLSSPHWIDALLATAGFATLAAAVAWGMLARRLARDWKLVAALGLAVAAAAGRYALLTSLESGAAFFTTIQILELTLAAGTVSWGALALLWGTLALSDAMNCRGAAQVGRSGEAAATNNLPSTSDRRRWIRVAAAGLAVALALYSLAPLWHLLGLRVNHWTVLGLFGLAGTAYGVGSLYRWLAAARHRDRT